MKGPEHSNAVAFSSQEKGRGETILGRQALPGVDYAITQRNWISYLRQYEHATFSPGTSDDDVSRLAGEVE